MTNPYTDDVTYNIKSCLRSNLGTLGEQMCDWDSPEIFRPPTDIENLTEIFAPIAADMVLIERDEEYRTDVAAVLATAFARRLAIVSYQTGRLPIIKYLTTTREHSKEFGTYLLSTLVFK